MTRSPFAQSGHRKSPAAPGNRKESVVGDGHAVGVAVEVGQYLRGPDEVEFAIDHPGGSTASFWQRLHGMSLEIPRKATIDAAVERYSHSSYEIIHAVAFSGKATPCFRVTVGNHAKKSPMVPLPSR